MSSLPPDPIFCFKEDMGYIHCLSFLLRGKNASHILAATEKGTVYFWDLETNRLQHKQEMGNSIQAIHCIGSNIITQEKVGTVKLWLPKGTSYNITKTRDCSSGYCKSIIFDEYLIIAKENGSVEILTVNNLKKIKELTPNKECLGHIMVLEKIIFGQKRLVLAGYETGNIILWNLGSLQPCGHLKVQEHLLSLTFDSEKGRGVCGNTSEILQVFTIDSDLKMEIKAELTITNEGCNVLKLRPDRKILVSGGSDGNLRVFSWRTLRLLAVLSEHRAAVTDIQFSPVAVKYWKSKIIAACSADGVISLWNIYN